LAPAGPPRFKRRRNDSPSPPLPLRDDNERAIFAIQTLLEKSSNDWVDERTVTVREALSATTTLEVHVERLQQLLVKLRPCPTTVVTDLITAWYTARIGEVQVPMEAFQFRFIGPEGALLKTGLRHLLKLHDADLYRALGEVYKERVIEMDEQDFIRVTNAGGSDAGSGDREENWLPVWAKGIRECQGDDHTRRYCFCDRDCIHGCEDSD
jgi:hypothetical protein